MSCFIGDFAIANFSIATLVSEDEGSCLSKQMYINYAQKVSPPPSNKGFNFLIICHIINIITLLGVEFNNAHFDTSLT